MLRLVPGVQHRKGICAVEEEGESGWVRLVFLVVNSHGDIDFALVANILAVNRASVNFASAIVCNLVHSQRTARYCSAVRQLNITSI